GRAGLVIAHRLQHSAPEVEDFQNARMPGDDVRGASGVGVDEMRADMAGAELRVHDGVWRCREENDGKANASSNHRDTESTEAEKSTAFLLCVLCVVVH